MGSERVPGRPHAASVPTLLRSHSHASRDTEDGVWVSVRLLPHEAQDRVAWQAADCTTLARQDLPTTPSGPSTTFSYDRVFGESVTCADVYGALSQRFVESARGGGNFTLFAYGQMGSGKTRTMRAVMRAAAADIFLAVHGNADRLPKLSLSAFEIDDKDIVKNMLVDQAAASLKVMRAVEHGTVAEGLREVVVLSESHLMELLETVETHRRGSETRMDASSSRSHQIVRISIHSHRPVDQKGDGCGRDSGKVSSDVGEDASAAPQLPRRPNSSGSVASASKTVDGGASLVTTQSVITFVDLAGLEDTSGASVAASGSDGARSEASGASNITRSMLTLGTVIRALGEAPSATPQHVPYHESRLTQLLQPSLSGDSRVALICTISPAAGSSEATLAVLQFADSVKRAELRHQAGSGADDRTTLHKMQAEVQELRALLAGHESWLQALSQATDELRSGQQPRRMTSDQRNRFEQLVATSQEVVSGAHSPRGVQADMLTPRRSSSSRRPSLEALEASSSVGTPVVAEDARQDVAYASRSAGWSSARKRTSTSVSQDGGMNAGLDDSDALASGRRAIIYPQDALLSSCSLPSEAARAVRRGGYLGSATTILGSSAGGTASNSAGSTTVGGTSSAVAALVASFMTPACSSGRSAATTAAASPGRHARAAPHMLHQGGEAADGTNRWRGARSWSVTDFAAASTPARDQHQETPQCPASPASSSPAVRVLPTDVAPDARLPDVTQLVAESQDLGHQPRVAAAAHDDVSSRTMDSWRDDAAEGVAQTAAEGVAHTAGLHADIASQADGLSQDAVAQDGVHPATSSLVRDDANVPTSAPAQRALPKGVQDAAVQTVARRDSASQTDAQPGAFLRRTASTQSCTTLQVVLPAGGGEPPAPDSARKSQLSTLQGDPPQDTQLSVVNPCSSHLPVLDSCDTGLTAAAAAIRLALHASALPADGVARPGSPYVGELHTQPFVSHAVPQAVDAVRDGARAASRCQHVDDLLSAVVPNSIAAQNATHFQVSARHRAVLADASGIDDAPRPHEHPGGAIAQADESPLSSSQPQRPFHVVAAALSSSGETSLMADSAQAGHPSIAASLAAATSSAGQSSHSSASARLLQAGGIQAPVRLADATAQRSGASRGLSVEAVTPRATAQLADGTRASKGVRVVALQAAPGRPDTSPAQLRETGVITSDAAQGEARQAGTAPPAAELDVGDTVLADAKGASAASARVTQNDVWQVPSDDVVGGATMHGCAHHAASAPSFGGWQVDIGQAQAHRAASEGEDAMYADIIPAFPLQPDAACASFLRPQFDMHAGDAHQPAVLTAHGAVPADGTQLGDDAPMPQSPDDVSRVIHLDCRTMPPAASRNSSPARTFLPALSAAAATAAVTAAAGTIAARAHEGDRRTSTAVPSAVRKRQAVGVNAFNWLMRRRRLAGQASATGGPSVPPAIIVSESREAAATTVSKAVETSDDTSHCASASVTAGAVTSAPRGPSGWLRLLSAIAAAPAAVVAVGAALAAFAATSAFAAWAFAVLASAGGLVVAAAVTISAALLVAGVATVTLFLAFVSVGAVATSVAAAAASVAGVVSVVEAVVQPVLQCGVVMAQKLRRGRAGQVLK